MTTQVETNSNMNKTNWFGITMFIVSGLVVFFLLVLGTLTDNRFGTHMVLNSDLSSGPDWYLWLISIVALLIVLTGIVLKVLNLTKVFKVNESQDRTLTIGSYLLMGTSAFILALSSISFAAFNWQFFESQIENGTAVAAQAMMSLTIIAITLSLAYIVFGMFVPLNANEKLYLTLRNSTMGLIALGWLVFNLCINSFGSMGGDANVLVAGLTGNEDLLLNVGTLLGAADTTVLGDILTNMSAMDAKTFYQTYLEDIVVGQIGLPGKWTTAQIVFAPFYNEGTGPLINQLGAFGALVEKHGGLQSLLADAGSSISSGALEPVISNLSKDLIELASGKEGMIMGVNNSFNSFAIFTALLGLGIIGLPAYGVLTYNGTSRDKKSIMFIGSIIVIIAMTILYLFLALTPYMVSYDIDTQHVGLLGLLLTGNFDPSIAPGLIALPGEAGGIHSAIVYFSDEYSGTIIWWISEVITIATPIAAFVGTTLYIKLRK